MGAKHEESQTLPPELATGTVVASVDGFRDALRRRDIERAQDLRWLAPRPPGERDLLSDLAAAEGIATAIQQLSRFWREATVRVEHIRTIGACEAELYERLILPSESLPIVTLVRRESAAAPWKVVCTNEAYDERFGMWIAVDVDIIDDVDVTLALPAEHGGQLLMDGDQGVLGHETHPWLAHVRGPFVPDVWPETLPGEGGRIVELATALSADSVDRRAQLTWLLASVRAFLTALGGDAVYLPSEDRVLVAGAMEAIVSGVASAKHAFRFWARVESNGVWVHTSGLRLLGSPEVEAREDVFADPALARRVVQWLAEILVGDGENPSLGTELLIGDESLLVTVGRRGARMGRSYGRWGALRLERIDRVGSKGSRARMRMPRELVEA